MTSSAAWAERLRVLARPLAWPRPAQAVGASALIALVVALLLWARAPEYKVLFSNLEDRDGGAIVSTLAQMNVPYKLSETGTAILVPADRVHGLRLQLAQQGLPRSGAAGFELMDNTRFGASQFTEQVTYQRALEGELANTIRDLHAVQAARVHLALPRQSLFVRERQAPTASVLLTLYPGRSLSDAQVNAITWLVSSSVPHLTAENVSVVDQNGRLLTQPAGDAGADGARRTLIDDIEQRTIQRILTLLNPLVGAGNVRAQASADVDFSQREQTSEVYRPNQEPGQAAVRSKQTSASSQRNVPPPEGVPGALTNQPPANATAPIQTPPATTQDAGGTQAGGQADVLSSEENAAGHGSGSSRRDATINYEVDRTISHTRQPLGTLNRLSVAVVVNYRDTDTGPEPLSDEEMAKIDALVKQAMGYSASRGDTLSVVNSAFTETDIARVPLWRDPVYIDMALRLLRYLLVALVVYLIWRRIVKPMLARQAREREQVEADVEQQARAREHAEAQERLAAALSRHEENLNTARDMANKDPRAVAMVLRTWMEKKDGSL
ncbi:flagellar basal body M-ring protein FliF [Allopusillimonas soli]|uniref:Flagellar M-ring protein n=1 Tax=Allopusillimonas soli TaxID=659016 RepID=A0A853F4R1_9BURK|nr:flagellar basal-body MS-ring/collar protein FliF [Allopusillimonas soli]NYT35504.1 flagellar M-ring protein FliF [Allopusillimonas soli]TEA75915.1 flagellar basal body M-ring protein FliF [Allopusillimonas soli]